MLRKLTLLAASVVALAAAPALPQTTQPPQPAPGDRVVVEGQRVEDAVRSFIDEVGAAPPGHNLARWDRKVCVGVVNMTGRYAQALVDQVSAIALAIGLDIGEPGCRPDILVLADSDGDALAARLIADNPRTFRPNNDSSSLGHVALDKFRTSHAPIRWWHVTQTVLSDTGAPATGNISVRVRTASRIRSNVREEMARVLIILDTSQIGKASLASLADYVAMVGLAQVDAQADAHAYNSILNLFANPSGDRTARMTQWDLDYLKALYAARGDAIRPGGQQSEIAGEMMKLPSTSGN